MKCALSDCKLEATHAAKVYIPATGWPAIPERALAMIAGIEMCRDHAAAFDVVESMPDIAEIAGSMARMHGSSIPPDVERAWVEPIRLDSAEFQSFKAMAERKPN